MPAVPVGVLLEDARSANHRGVVAGFGDELQANRERVVSETTGHGKRWQSTKVADAAERIGKNKFRLEIGFERRGGNWLRRRDKYVEILEQVGHLLLRDFAHLQCAH